jgi:hypothetical protein
MRRRRLVRCPAGQKVVVVVVVVVLLLLMYSVVGSVQQQQQQQQQQRRQRRPRSYSAPIRLERCPAARTPPAGRSGAALPPAHVAAATAAVPL